MQSASIVLKRIAKQFDDYYTRPLLKDWYDWNMQYSDKPEIRATCRLMHAAPVS